MNLNKTFISTIKLLIIIISISYIIIKIRYEINNNTDFTQEISNFHKYNLFYLLFSIILMPINWFLESLKFKILLHNIQTISNKQSIKAILSGITVSIFMPKRIGDFGGRIIFLKKNNKIKGVLATLLGSMSQLIITIIIGLSFFPAYLNYNNILQKYNINENIIFAFSLLSIIIVLFIFLNISKLNIYIKRVSFLNKYNNLLSFVNQYTKKQLLSLLTLSLLRYFIFSSQFILLLHSFNVTLPYNEAIIGISQIYFLMIVIPVFSLGELSIRGSLSVWVLNSFTPLVSGVLATSILLWFINLAIPAIIGSIFILKTPHNSSSKI